jgi:formyl-CoA transferase
MGAEVIKVEEPVGGDRLRGIFNSGGLTSIVPPNPVNYPWELSARGKKSVGIDIRTPQGRDLIYRLLPNIDVFVSSLRKKSLRKYGLDYESVSKVNPRLIFVHLSTFGARGPDADLPGQDLTGMARAGLVNLLRHNPEDEILAEGPFSIGDFTGSLQLAYAATLALLAREKTGVGQEVNVSIMGALIAVQEWLFQTYLTTEKEPSLREHHQMNNPIRNTYKCQDGKYIALGMTEGDRYWPVFCATIGRPELAGDPRFSDIVKRASNNEELIAILDEVFLSKTRDEWCALMRENDCTASPVQSYADLASDPQVLANNYVTTVEHPTHGPIKEVGITVDLTETPGQAKNAAPELGQHTEEVLIELAGLGWEELGHLKDARVII